MNVDIEVNRRGWRRAVVSSNADGIICITPWRKFDEDAEKDARDFIASTQDKGA